MIRRVLVAPAPLREIANVYSPILERAGYTIEHPARPNFGPEAQMTEAELLEQLPGCLGSLAGSEPYTRAVIARAAAAGLKVIARAGVGYDAIDLQADWFRNVGSVGLTAGASAPEILVQGVIEGLRRFDQIELTTLDGVAEDVRFRFPSELADT